MYRSWAYILMVAATLVGVVALLWPSPQQRSIEELASVTHEAPPRAEAPPKASKPSAKPGARSASKPAAAAAAPPAVVKRVPQSNTVTKRGGAMIQNGIQQGPFNQPIPESALPPAPPGAVIAPKPGAPVTARPLVPPRPPAGPGQPTRPAAPE